jgi:hypothetical protein
MDSATEEQLKAENEKLNSENERLNAEMASMKKKIKLALKKQQADLQAKIQAAEQRAAAAEGALAAADAPAISNVGAEVDAAPWSQSNEQIAVVQSADDGTDSAASSSSTLSSLGGANGDNFHHPLFQEGNGNSTHSHAHVDSLVAELANERRQRLEQEDLDLKERQRLSNEINECNYLCILPTIFLKIINLLQI